MNNTMSEKENYINKLKSQIDSTDKIFMNYSIKKQKKTVLFKQTLRS